MISQQIRNLSDRVERATGVSDFGATVFCLLQGKGRISDARTFAKNFSPRTQRIIERAQPGSLDTASPEWGGELSDYRQVAEGFISSLGYGGRRV